MMKKQYFTNSTRNTSKKNVPAARKRFLRGNPRILTKPQTPPIDVKNYEQKQNIDGDHAYACPRRLLTRRGSKLKIYGRPPRVGDPDNFTICTPRRSKQASHSSGAVPLRCVWRGRNYQIPKVSSKSVRRHPFSVITARLSPAAARAKRYGRLSPLLFILCTASVDLVCGFILTRMHSRPRLCGQILQQYIYIPKSRGGRRKKSCQKYPCTRYATKVEAGRGKKLN